MLFVFLKIAAAALLCIPLLYFFRMKSGEKPSARDSGVCTVRLHSPPEAEVLVRQALNYDETPLQPQEDGTYPLLPGVYHYLFRQQGFCPVCQIFLIKEQDAGTVREIRTDAVSLSGRPAEYSGEIYRLSDELEENLYKTEDIAGFDAGKILTPAFSEEKQFNCFTSVKERAAYLTKLQEKSSWVNVFFPEENSFPIAVFTKERISGQSGNSAQREGTGQTAEEGQPGCSDQFWQNAWADLGKSLEILRRSGKVNVFYQAQIHGSEPAAGEGALAIAGSLAGEDGEKLLEKINLVLIPCANPKGSEHVLRNNGEINMNRDSLMADCRETEILHRVFQKLAPEIAIDGHTFTRKNTTRADNLAKCLLDARISAAKSGNIDENVGKMAERIMENALQELRDANLRVSYYSDSVNSAVSRVYYGMHNCCSLLVESEGTKSAKMHFARNVWTHYVAVQSILSFAYCHGQEIKQCTARARAERLAANRRYEKENVFVLEHGRSGKQYYRSKMLRYDFAGNIAEENYFLEFPKYDLTVRSRVRPTAYVLRKDWENAGAAVRVLEKHGIRAEELPEGSRIELSQYRRAESGAIEYTEEKEELLEKGGYIIFMDQLGANIISALLEPDAGDVPADAGTPVHRGIIAEDESGRYPVFRCHLDEPRKFTEKQLES